MQDIFVLNPNATAIDLKDAIYTRINKAKAILTCVMFAAEVLQRDPHLGAHSLYHALWAADDNLKEMETLLTQLENRNYN